MNLIFAHIDVVQERTEPVQASPSNFAIYNPQRLCGDVSKISAPAEWKKRKCHLARDVKSKNFIAPKTGKYLTPYTHLSHRA